MAEGHEFLEYLYLSCKGPAASERALAAGKAGEDIPLPVKFSPITLSKPAKPARPQQQVKFFPQRPSRQSRRGHPFSSGILPISPPSRQSRRGPQQVTSKLKYEAKPPLQMRQLKIGHFGVEPPASYQQVKLCPKRNIFHIPWSSFAVQWFNQIALNRQLDEA